MEESVFVVGPYGLDQGSRPQSEAFGDENFLEAARQWEGGVTAQATERTDQLLREPEARRGEGE